MNENNHLRDRLRALAEAMPQDADPSVEQQLLASFRERSANRRRHAYLMAAAASVVMAAVLYLGLGRHRNAASVVPVAYDQADFIMLPYGQSGVPLEQPVIVRVNIPVSELRMIGVPFTPPGSRERVKADLLIGQDGVARAVRFVE